MTESSGFYFVGIGGVGMSAIAKTALEQGMEVAGSDIKQSQTTDFLQDLGARVHFDQGTAAIPKDMTVVVSSATKDNPQVLQAQKLGLKILHRSDALAKIMGGLKNLLVAGVHGKTTTSALLISIFIEGGLDPSFCIGGIHSELKTNGKSGKGPYFIAEADESDGTHLKYNGYGGIITSLESDHLDHYKTLENLRSSMQEFLLKIKQPKHLFFCGDDYELSQLNPKGVSYGFSPHNHLRASNYRQNEMCSFIDIEYEGQVYKDVEIALIGRHMAQNALGAFGLALSLGVTEVVVRAALKNFKGVYRRMQKHFCGKDLLCLDDYAHHPTAVRMNLEALKVAFPDRRLVVAFQPHRYTRLKSLLEEFAASFDAADEVLVTEVYSAGEQPVWDIESRDLIQKINARIPFLAKQKTLAQMPTYLMDSLRPFDVLVTMGAGNLLEIHTLLTSHFEVYGPRKLKAAVISGGQSLEHEVSQWSGVNVEHAIGKSTFDIDTLSISKEGKWIGRLGPISGKEVLKKYDVIFPILHGGSGENGEVQATLNQYNIPFVGSGVLGCALAMDKEAARLVVRGQGFQAVEMATLTQKEWILKGEGVLEALGNINFPVMVKPASGGSTFGVTCVQSKEELLKAIESLFRVDVKLLIEPKLNCRELEFAAFEGPQGLQVLPPGEVFSSGRIYDFDSKYGRGGAVTSSPRAELRPGFMQRYAEQVKKIFKALNLEGYARIDFFYDDKADQLIFNEANAIPGFTDWSLFPVMLEKNGIELKEFWALMARLARARARAQMRVKMQLLKYGEK